MKCPICSNNSIKVKTPNDYDDKILVVCEDNQSWSEVSMYQCSKNIKHIFYIDDNDVESDQNTPIVILN